MNDTEAKELYSDSKQQLRDKIEHVAELRDESLIKKINALAKSLDVESIEDPIQPIEQQLLIFLQLCKLTQGQQKKLCQHLDLKSDSFPISDALKWDIAGQAVANPQLLAIISRFTICNNVTSGSKKGFMTEKCRAWIGLFAENEAKEIEVKLQDQYELRKFVLNGKIAEIEIAEYEQQQKRI